MSSGNLLRTQDPQLFAWSPDCDPADYLLARYVVTSTQDGEGTALAMAMEQSAATTRIRGYVEPDMLAASTIRVRGVSAMPEGPRPELAPYQLATEVYAATAAVPARQWSI